MPTPDLPEKISSFEDVIRIETEHLMRRRAALTDQAIDQKEFEYAVVVGQLIALLDPETTIEVISAMPSSEILLEMMQSSDMNCHWIQIQPENS